MQKAARARNARSGQKFAEQLVESPKTPQALGEIRNLKQKIPAPVYIQ